METNETTQAQPAETQTTLLQATAEQAKADTSWLPEKFATLKDDGQLDIETSAKKLAESYTYLEKKQGAGDVPPKSPEEYAPKIEVEGFDFEQFKQDEKGASFLKGAHAKGMSNEQVAYVLQEYLGIAPELVSGAKALDERSAQEALSQVWKSPAEMQQNLQGAYKAVTAYGGDLADSLMTKYGNDPEFIRYAAAIAKDMREDSAPKAAAVVGGKSFEEQKAELAAELLSMDANDPRRAAVLSKQTALYERQFAAAS